MKNFKGLSVVLLTGILFSVAIFTFAEEIDITETPMLVPVEFKTELNVESALPKELNLENSTTATTIKPCLINLEIPPFTFDCNSDTTLDSDVLNVYPVIVKIQSISGDTGISDADFTTSDSSPNFFGITIPNTEVKVSVSYSRPCNPPINEFGVPCIEIHESLIGTTYSDENGNWVLENTNTLMIDGTYYAFPEIVVEDEVITSDSIRLIIDTKKPELGNTYLHYGASTEVHFDILDSLKVNTNKLVITGTITDDNIIRSEIILWNMRDIDNDSNGIDYYRKIGYSKEFEGQFESNLNFDLSEFNLEDSDYRVTIISFDDAGNEISFGEKTFAFRIDSAAPDAPIITSPLNPVYSGGSTIEVIGTCDIEADHLSFTFETIADSSLNRIGNNFTKDTTCNLEGNFKATIDILSDGVFSPFKIAVVQVDAFGNMSPVSNIITITEPVKSSGGGGGGGGSNIPPAEKCEILGDINCDGKVNKYDFSLMMMSWGFKKIDKADLNKDIGVDKYDFSLLMSNWGFGEN